MKYRYETNDDATYHLLLQQAKRMRSQPTEAERTLWKYLKGNQLGAHFRQQHPIFDYIPDFVCLSRRLIIELDGDYHLTEDKSASLSQADTPSLREGRGGSTGRLLIFSAPSGSGKSTIVQWLMKEHPELNLHFSISCTSRAPRGTEQNGVEYFFLTPEEFKQKIANGEFLEYEEVYKDRFYGTLKSQVEDQIERGENVVFDVDVKGGCNIKQFYGDRAMSIFVQPPSIEELRRRLNGRGTDLPEVIEQRLAKANYELSFAPKFDRIVVNDDLETAKQETHKLLISFLNNR